MSDCRIQCATFEKGVCLLKPGLHSSDAPFFEPACACRPKPNWFGTELVVFSWTRTLVGSPQKRDDVSEYVLFLTTIRRLECDGNVLHQVRAALAKSGQRVGPMPAISRKLTHSEFFFLHPAGMREPEPSLWDGAVTHPCDSVWVSNWSVALPSSLAL